MYASVPFCLLLLPFFCGLVGEGRCDAVGMFAVAVLVSFWFGCGDGICSLAQFRCGAAVVWYVRWDGAVVIPLWPDRDGAAGVTSL